MSKFIYVGVGIEDPAEAVFMGYKFKLNGNPIEVKNQEAIDKLKGNRTFKEVAEKAPKAETPKNPTVKTES